MPKKNKSALKALRRSLKRRARNRAYKERIKERTKAVFKALLAGKIEEAKELLKKAASAIDKAYEHGVIHRNTAARKKSRLMRRFNKMLAEILKQTQAQA